MFIEAIDSHKRAIDQYCTMCRDSVSSSIASSLRDTLSGMGKLAQSCEEAGRKLRQSEELGESIAKRKDAIMARVSQLIPSFQIKHAKYGSSARGSGSFGGKNIGRDSRQFTRVGNQQKVGSPMIVNQYQESRREHVMNEKDNEAAKDFLSAFHTVQSIEEELRKAEETLSCVLEARKNIRSLSEMNGQLDSVNVVDSAELRRIEEQLQTANRIKNAAAASAGEFDANQSRLQLIETELRHIRAGLDAVRPSIVHFKKFWHGFSSRSNKILSRIDAVLSACNADDTKKASIRKTNAALYNEATAIRRKWTTEVDNLSRRLSQANENRRTRATLIEKIRLLVDNIATELSRLSGKSASQFSTSRSIEDGRSLSVLAPNVNPQSVFSDAMAAQRQKLYELSERCRMRQPRLANIRKSDMNLTAVFPKHIICAESFTNALGGGDLVIPYSLRFPFEKPLVFGNESDIAPFLIRLLYVLPAGKLQIIAIDHKSAGENIGVLNALCEHNGQLRIVTCADEITPLLRELDGLMGEMTRSVFTYKENDWAAYNAAHPESSIPLRVVPIFTMQGFSATQLDMLQKLLENGPRFGIICVLADSASEDLDDRLHDRFEEFEFDNDRIEESGTEIGEYENLSLEMVAESTSRQKLGELSELYASTYREISKTPKREIKFESLFDGIDLWKGQTIDGISTTIGWDASGMPVNFEFGVGRCASAYHALVGGTTGSGKSVFLHTLIQSLAGKYSPDELLFYLLDYKKGDEFKKYADVRGNAWLPHVKMISRHKDPRFALELFDFLDKEFKRRSDQFGNYGDIVAYRKNGGKIPRIVVIIDEFQVMFEEYCGLNLSDEVAKRLSTVFKQGRSYGIHLVLATQSLASLHFSGMAGILGQIGLRIALKGMAQDGILADGNRAAENIIPKRQCIVNPAFGLKDSDGTVNNIITDVPFSDPAQVEGCKKFRTQIERKAQELHMKSACRVFNGAELPMVPDADVISESLRSEKWNTFFTLLLGARTDFSSTPFAVDFTEEQREHLLVAGEDGSLSSDSEVRISGEDVWDGLRRGIMRSLRSLRSCEVLYYNPAVGAVPQDVPDYFICLSGRAKEKDLLDAFQELESSKSEKKIVMIENFQDARLLHPGDAPRASFSSRPAEPQPQSVRTMFASLFNGTDDPKYHVIVMTKNFGFMNKEVLARSGAEANILKGCAKRVAFNLSDDDLTAMIPHQKVSDRRGPRRVWFEDMRTGTVLDFLPYGNVK